MSYSHLHFYNTKTGKALWKNNIGRTIDAGRGIAIEPIRSGTRRRRKCGVPKRDVGATGAVANPEGTQIWRCEYDRTAGELPHSGRHLTRAKGFPHRGIRRHPHSHRKGKSRRKSLLFAGMLSSYRRKEVPKWCLAERRLTRDHGTRSRRAREEISCATVSLNAPIVALRYSKRM